MSESHQTARERLAWQLQNPGLVGLDEYEANELIDGFANELAETIRNADYPAHATDGADYAADLIDPSAGPVRSDEEPTL